MNSKAKDVPDQAQSGLSDPAGQQRWNQTVLPLLEQIAERHLLGERESITLEAADLVQEAYLRLADLAMPFNDRQHFLSMVSTAMRRVFALSDAFRDTHGDIADFPGHDRQISHG